jgi:P-type E1-E2 ATPase
MDAEVIVFRGKAGSTQSVSIYDLAVGDVVLLETGSRVPADCILFEGTDVVCNEGTY